MPGLRSRIEVDVHARIRTKLVELEGLNLVSSCVVSEAGIGSDKGSHLDVVTITVTRTASERHDAREEVKRVVLGGDDSMIEAETPHS